MKILTAAELAEADLVTSKKFGVPSLSLMENAGSAVAEFVLKNYSEARTIGVICGKGNNGGDGFVTARKLREGGKRVEVLLLAEPKDLRGDAAKSFERLTAKTILARNQKELNSEDAQRVLASEILVDAILGTGFKPPLNELYAAAIERVNASTRPVVAVDIPSGLTADESSPSAGLFVCAGATVTFTAPKQRLIFDAVIAESKLLVAEIGSPSGAIQSGLGLEVITPRDFAMALPPRRADSHKGDYGHVLVVAGSVGKSGAAAMAGMAALRAGAGLVTVATPRSVQPLVAGYAPELMTEPLEETPEGTVSRRALENLEKLLAGKTTVALGPGLTTHTETAEFVRELVRQCEAPLVLDADGLNAFAGGAQRLQDRRANLFLTPHPGEMARLIGGLTADIQRDRVAIARRFAREHGLVLILKGFATLVALPHENVWINPTGNAAMAKGGMGDVLTGILAGMIAQNSFHLTGQDPAVKQDVPASLVNRIRGAKSGDEIDASEAEKEWLLKNLQISESLAWSPIFAAVYLHGLAGDLARDEADEHTIVATDLLRTLPRAFQLARERLHEKLVRIR